MVSSFGFDDMLLSIHRDRKWFIPVVHQRQDKMVFLQPRVIAGLPLALIDSVYQKLGK